MAYYSYLISFAIDPVQSGFVCRSLPNYKQFKGLNAFNEYFDMLKPGTDAKSIPDVWPGYYRIALVQFQSRDLPQVLEEKVKSLHPELTSGPIQEPLFKTSKMDISPECFRFGEECVKESMALYMTRSSKLTLTAALEEIRSRINPKTWIMIPEDELHMVIHLYGRQLTWQQVEENHIPASVMAHPIEFYQTRLEIIPSRNAAKWSYEETGDLWRLGVTTLGGYCSGCWHRIRRKEWRGVCPACMQYERVKPVWSVSISSSPDSSKDSNSNRTTMEPPLDLSSLRLEKQLPSNNNFDSP
ncbi:unnamed protein product [Adineta ricciae]|uniref:Uncharacterized protein n=2 Tax=Adineta ricciae TaxID=249248 RepID=A0A815BN45_ADIRI|nr:unnamed protein product [Adineta ricciae]